jgi:hypothetical protein
MKRIVISFVFVLSGISFSEAQIWTMPPEPTGVYRVYGPGGRSGLKESQPAASYCISGDQAQVITLTLNGASGTNSPGERTWIVQPNTTGGYNTYGPRGQTWASRTSSAGTSSGEGPDGQSWISWQTSTGSHVTYERGGRMWVSTPNSIGGHTTYAPGGGTWISQPLAPVSQPCEPARDQEAQRPALPTPEYPLPVPAHSRPQFRQLPPAPLPMSDAGVSRST